MLSVFSKTLAYSAVRKTIRFFPTPLKSNYEGLPKCAINTKYFRHKHTFIPGLREGPHSSRYHPGSNIELAEEHVCSILEDKTYMNDEDWNNFKIDITTDQVLITEENFTAIVMNCLLFKNKLDLAHSLIKYLENNSMKTNFITYLKYISLCSRHRKQVGQELILKTFNKVKFLVDNSPVLDMKTAEYTIQGLCATEKWKDAFEYLNKINGKPSLAIHSALACAAVRNDNEMLAWDILKKWIKPGEVPSDHVIEEFLLVALEKQKVNPCTADTFLQEIFQYMQMKNLIVSVNVIKVIEQYFKCHRLKWNLKYTKVSRKKGCEECGFSLKLVDLTTEEFNFLKNAFLERVVKKTDVFINTTPKEFDNYIDFIDKFKPFHVVIDGLNAAYSYPYGKSQKNLAAQLCKVTKALAGSSRKVLVMGRKHMRMWPNFIMSKISERARLFYTDNISQDDPFLIYAALASGPHTFFLSDDLMRDHMSRLYHTETIQLFKRWQQSHQIFLTVDKENSLKFTQPLRHSINTQGSMEHGWHIPYDDKIILDPYEELNNWLCIQRVL